MLDTVLRKVVCTPPCERLLSVSEKYCSQCGSKSNHFDDKMGKAFAVHDKKSWTKPKKTSADVAITDEGLWESHHVLPKCLQSKKKKLLAQNALPDDKGDPVAKKANNDESVAKSDDNKEANKDGPVPKKNEKNEKPEEKKEAKKPPVRRSFTYEELGHGAANPNMARYVKARYELLESLKSWCEGEGQAKCAVNDLDWPSFKLSVAKHWGRRWVKVTGKQTAAAVQDLKTAIAKKKDSKDGHKLWRHFVQYWQSKAADLKL